MEGQDDEKPSYETLERIVCAVRRAEEQLYSMY